MVSTQEGQNDCGLFALTYAVEIARNKDPSSKVFDQSKMRQHFFDSLESGFIIPFPIKRINTATCREEEITKKIHPNNKWTFPKKTFTGLRDQHLRKDIPLSNRFCILDKQSRANKADKTRDESKYISGCHSKGPFKNCQSQSAMYNLSKHVLSVDEKSVLELGLSFTPSQRKFNKEKFTNDIHNFIRRLKLKEYFHETDNQGSKVIKALKRAQNQTVQDSTGQLITQTGIRR